MRVTNATDGQSEVHKWLSQHIKPVVQNRSLWKGEHERMLPGHDGRPNIV